MSSPSNRQDPRGLHCVDHGRRWSRLDKTDHGQRQELARRLVVLTIALFAVELLAFRDSAKEEFCANETLARSRGQEILASHKLAPGGRVGEASHP